MWLLAGVVIGLGVVGYSSLSCLYLLDSGKTRPALTSARHSVNVHHRWVLQTDATTPLWVTLQSQGQPNDSLLSAPAPVRAFDCKTLNPKDR